MPPLPITLSNCVIPVSAIAPALAVATGYTGMTEGASVWGLEAKEMSVRCGRGAKARVEPQPVSGTQLMQHRIGVAPSAFFATSYKAIFAFAPRSDAPKVVRIIVSTRYKAKRLIPLYSWGSGDV